MRPRVPVVSTRRLFERLLCPLGIDAICDIGSMDGSEALSFHRRRPGAMVIAFEANPANFERMRNDPELGVAGIRCEPLAVSDGDGRANFFVVRASEQVRTQRGMSSLYPRRQPEELEAVVQVETTRLDTYLGRHAPHATSIALWIDVEGKAFEVITGARDALAKVQLMHIEVESTPLIADAQRTYREVCTLLEDRGFVEIATDQSVHNLQFNTVWMRAHQSEVVARAVRRELTRLLLRRCVRDVVLFLVPRSMVGYLSGLFAARRRG